MICWIPLRRMEVRRIHICCPYGESKIDPLPITIMTKYIRSNCCRGKKIFMPWDNLKIWKKILPKISVPKSMKPWALSCKLLTPSWKMFLPDFRNTDIYKYDNQSHGEITDFYPQERTNCNLGNFMIFFPLNVSMSFIQRNILLTTGLLMYFRHSTILTKKEVKWSAKRHIGREGGLKGVGKEWSTCWGVWEGHQLGMRKDCQVGFRD